MNASLAPPGPPPFASFSAGLSALAHAGVSRLLGAGADRPLLGALRWTDVVVAASLMISALVASGIVALLMRRVPRGRADPVTGQSVRDHVLGAVGKPLQLAIWIGGAYLAAIELLAPLGSGGIARALQTFADRLLDIGLFVALIWMVRRGTRVLDRRLESWAAKTKSRFDDAIAMLAGRSLRIVLPVLAVIFALPVLGLPTQFAGVVAKGTSVLLIATVAAVLFEVVDIFERALLARFDIGSADNLQARKVYTQVHVIGRVIRIAIGVFAGASVLMLFAEARNIGASLLASAGVVGIVAGIAAQRTLANLFAGFQIALAQPMCQDDVVIVEGEWGRIEEITLSYVVVRIWDDRRLVVPLAYFIEKPFQNWTRSSSQLLGSVYVWVDYSFPVERGRDALKRIIVGNPLWDGRFWNLQVTDANDKSMQLRVLATSADSSKSWDLRCQIREQFIEFIRSAHPGSLPTVRAQLGA
ncbi:MAG TPA: mechanosensitive ion channel domain-containing protein [Steroidobacteraceae bacterium]|nr:mechanosensitive ion channel domain-containing protein [Steroidobacteraceae bacterium]